MVMLKKDEIIKKLKILFNEKSETLSKLKDYIKPHAITYKKQIMLIGGGIIIILVFVSLLGHSGSSSKNNDSKEGSVQTQKIISSQLNDIAIKLATIGHDISRKNAVVDLDPVRQEIMAVENQTRTLSAKSNDLISHQISASTSQLETKLADISGQLKRLEDEKKHIKFLEVSDLPFVVNQIDNIQQENVVTISYNHTTFPINIGGYIAGWKLISADFSTQKAEFVNAKKQHVVVDLNRLNPVNEKGES